MNKYVLAAVLLIGLMMMWSFIRNSGSAGIQNISPAEAKKRLDAEKGIILLDVRNKDEYVQKHIPNSMLIPLNVLENQAASKLPDKEAEIFVYCASGSRSSAAVKTLVKLGYTNVYNLGGISRWPYQTVSGNK